MYGGSVKASRIDCLSLDEMTLPEQCTSKLDSIHVIVVAFNIVELGQFIHHNSRGTLHHPTGFFQVFQTIHQYDNLSKGWCIGIEMGGCNGQIRGFQTGNRGQGMEILPKS
jgi:hypothetical protein